jgi:hypothetical protein
LIFSDLAAEDAGADAQGFGRFCAIVMVSLERFDDEALLQFL